MCPRPSRGALQGASEDSHSPRAALLCWAPNGGRSLRAQHPVAVRRGDKAFGPSNQSGSRDRRSAHVRTRSSPSSRDRRPNLPRPTPGGQQPAVGLAALRERGTGRGGEEGEGVAGQPPSGHGSAIRELQAEPDAVPACTSQVAGCVECLSSRSHTRTSDKPCGRPGPGPAALEAYSVRTRYAVWCQGPRPRGTAVSHTLLARRGRGTINECNQTLRELKRLVNKLTSHTEHTNTNTHYVHTHMCLKQTNTKNALGLSEKG